MVYISMVDIQIAHLCQPILTLANFRRDPFMRSHPGSDTSFCQELVDIIPSQLCIFYECSHRRNSTELNRTTLSVKKCPPFYFSITLILIFGI